MNRSSFPEVCSAQLVQAEIGDKGIHEIAQALLRQSPDLFFRLCIVEDQIYDFGDGVSPRLADGQQPVDADERGAENMDGFGRQERSQLFQGIQIEKKEKIVSGYEVFQAHEITSAGVSLLLAYYVSERKRGLKLFRRPSCSVLNDRAGSKCDRSAGWQAEYPAIMPGLLRDG